MGNNQSGAGGDAAGQRGQDKAKEKKKFEPPPPPTRVGKKMKKKKGSDPNTRLPAVTPNSKCKLRLLKLERIKDWLLMEVPSISLE
jgi:26S proteasome regulatory subunit T2